MKHVMISPTGIHNNYSYNIKTMNISELNTQSDLKVIDLFRRTFVISLKKTVLGFMSKQIVLVPININNCSSPCS